MDYGDAMMQIQRGVAAGVTAYDVYKAVQRYRKNFNKKRVRIGDR